MTSLAVLITYFNEGPLLTECLESILHQAGAPDEVWVYDDSRDHSASRFIPTGAKVEVVFGTGDLGPSRGRNTLVRKSKSAYVHHHDADDLFLPNWAARVRKAIDESGADIILTEVSTLRDGRILRERFVELESPETPDVISLAFNGGILPNVATYRRQAFLAIGGYREDLTKSEDYDFHIRLAISVQSSHRILEPLALFRLRADGLTHRAGTEYVGWTHRTEILRGLSKELPAIYTARLGKEAYRNGCRLFRLGARREAREAFLLAGDLGGPACHPESPVWYQGLARLAGPMAAEWVLYVRHRIALALRQRLRRQPLHAA